MIVDPTDVSKPHARKMEHLAMVREAELQRALRRMWDDSQSYDEAREALGELAASVETRDPELAEWLEAEGEETLTCFHFPAEHRRRLRTTNGNERVNQELKRRSRVVRIFPNRESCLRLASALLKEWHEDWITGRRYLKKDALEDSDRDSESERELGEAA